VPLRLRLDGEPTFGELLTRVQQLTLGALDHRDLPFDRLVDDLAPRRDLSHNPLVQTLFLLQTAPQPVLELPGLAAEPVHVQRGGAQCDLSVQLREIDGRFTGFVEYAADLFRESTVRRWWGHLETVLAAAVAAPGCPIGELAWLTDEQTRRLLGDEQPAGAPGTTSDPTLGALLVRVAAGDPQAPALLGAGDSLDHGELARRTEEVARVLVERGAGPGELVAVHGDRDNDLVVSILGVLRAGAAYLPLNVDYPRERLARVLADARPAVVLSQTRRAADLPDGQPVLLVDDLPGPASDGPADLPAARPGDPAYVIYTSGSTGAPKGVVVEHRSVLNLLSWMQRRYPIGADDVVLLKTPTSFDVSVCELFWWAAAGARLAVLPAGAERDPRELLNTVERLGVTVVQFVPSMLGPFLDLLESDPRQAARAAGLRYVLCAGEELSADLTRRFAGVFAAAPRRPLLANLYGPTEATVYASAFDIPPEAGPVGPRVPIGTAVDGVGLLVVDPAGRVQPDGVPGELLLSGAGLATGYRGRPGLTAERFVPHPYAGVTPGVPPGARAYRTGDLCRRTPGGALEWLGRLDFQVKVRGFRIETGEVAAALVALPRVADAVVVHRREDRDPAGLLVGYVVATPGPEPTWSELRSGLRETLPEHMVPGAFVVLDALPLFPNGKVDRAVLPAPAPVRPELATGFVAPQTALEQVVAEVWTTVLHLDRVGAEDDFFDLGGQSLLATQVASALQEVLGVEVPLRAVFEAPTVAGQATLVAELGRAGGVDVGAVAGLVLEVRDLTEEQVQALLADHEG
jgi:amino acid adenylation domain-containing protein